MSDDIFDQGPLGEAERQIGMVTPQKVENQVEHALLNVRHEENTLADIGVPFVDGETGELENADEYPGFTLAEVIAVRDSIAGEIGAKFARQLAAARALGPKGTIEEYIALCEETGIDPIVRSLS